MEEMGHSSGSPFCIFLLSYFLPLGVPKTFVLSKAGDLPHELHAQLIGTSKVFELQGQKEDLESPAETETDFDPSSCPTYPLI